MTRSAYDDQNIFAKILRGDLPSEKVYEDENTLVIMDIMPRGDGHVLVLPKNGSRNILDIAEADLFATLKTTQKMAQIVKKAFDADGITIHQSTKVLAGRWYSTPTSTSSHVMLEYPCAHIAARWKTVKC